MHNYKDLCPDDVYDPADYPWGDLESVRIVVACAYPGCCEFVCDAACVECDAPLCRTHETVGICPECQSKTSEQDDLPTDESEIPF